MISDSLRGRYKTVDVDAARDQDNEALRLINSIVECGITDDRPLVRIPEAEFVNAWLPLFTGEPNHYNYNRQHYINRIGGMYRKALVVNAAGEVLFEVPPINDSDANLPVKMQTTKHEISSSMETFENERTLRPHAALSDLRTILMAHAEVMQSRKQPDRYLDEWNAIFRRYGKEEITLKRTNNGSNSPQTQDEQAPTTYQDI